MKEALFAYFMYDFIHKNGNSLNWGFTLGLALVAFIMVMWAYMLHRVTKED